MTKPLTPREREVMARICTGLTSQEIADELGITCWTVQNLRADAIKRLGAKNAAQAAVMFDRLEGARRLSGSW